MRLFCLTLLFATLSAFASETRLICSWTDANGITHFSTNQPKGATCREITPAAPIKYDSGKLPSTRLNNNANASARSTRSSTNAGPALAGNVATQIAILSPIDEATVRNNSGNIDVTVMVVPKLAEQQTIQLKIDGQAVGEPSRSIQQQLHNIDRGSHQLSADLLENGKVIASAPPVTVFLHRASILNREALNPPIQPRTK
ncbi:hypothetical protein [Plesiomonas shigelloides]|uniref:hypothetical protein n=1 Tax=Plesiomonas shigelloides TaxID=703 RepID=UPI001261693E|nr:hypothetical protein [Plesiomonas shigelloides]KAB7657827.1 hypothetical protein GBN14_06725 [Plesiomonas shigelloides]